MSPPLVALALTPALLAAPAASPEGGDDRAVLAESFRGTARATLSVSASGELVPRPGADPLETAVVATYAFRTRRIPADGDGPTGRRAVRYYATAGSELKVGKQPTYARLRPDRRVIVATGSPRGVDVLCPTAPLRYGEIELLGTPLDPLLVGGLLPAASVAAGETWEPPDWVAPALAGVEAVAESDMTCELTTLTAREARGTFEGRVAGATDGAEVAVTLAGTFAFDRRRGLVTAAELEQTVRSTPGPVSPGAKLSLTAKLAVEPADDGPLTAAALAAARAAVADPDSVAENSRAELVTPWGPRAALDRGWRFVNQTARAAVLLRLENGAPAVAATLAPADAAAGGDLDAFAASVRDRLPGGARVTEETTLNIAGDADPGRSVLLVRIAAADAAGNPRIEDRYLVSTGAGDRAEVTVTYAPADAELAETVAFPLLDALRWPDR